MILIIGNHFIKCVCLIRSDFVTIWEMRLFHQCMIKYCRQHLINLSISFLKLSQEIGKDLLMAKLENYYFQPKVLIMLMFYLI